MKMKYLKPTMMVYDIEPMVPLAGSTPNDPQGFDSKLDSDASEDGSCALSAKWGTSIWVDE